MFGVLAHINVFVTSEETPKFRELSRSQYPKDCLNQGGRQFSDWVLRGSDKVGSL